MMNGKLPLIVDRTADPVETAESAGLVYVTDHGTGIRRVKCDDGFCYVTAAGTTIEDQRTLERIISLRIPPAWTNVWICVSADGHIQATGRDEKGRKQYIYHTKWREVRDETKFGKMITFGHKLPALRERINSDIAKRGMPREKVLAAVVKLLQETLIRVGNDEYARYNDSYGLTTLQTNHVDVRGSGIIFRFRGKKGKFHEIGVRDPRLAKIVRRCQELPGQELFVYIDDNGVARDVGSGDVNTYLREITGEDFTAKDFRTWAGTVYAAVYLDEIGPATTHSEAKRKISQAIRQVSERLGNTPAVARRAYIHPLIVESYLDGSLSLSMAGVTCVDCDEDNAELRPAEEAVLCLLERRCTAESKAA